MKRHTYAKIVTVCAVCTLKCTGSVPKEIRLAKMKAEYYDTSTGLKHIAILIFLPIPSLFSHSGHIVYWPEGRTHQQDDKLYYH